VTTLTVRTERQSQLVDITRLVRDAVTGKSGSAVLVYVPHTTAGVTINEHADPMVARDFEMALGTWQGIFFCEFDGPRERSVHVSVLA
jgi:thiamine phosphate synthase YjbQ (UPF0047 family)